MISAPPAMPPCRAIQPAWASHHFDDHHSPVTGRSSVQPIERIDHYINGRIESERRGCGFEIVVNGLWNPDAIDPGIL
jgi:hypothetical protein